MIDKLLELINSYYPLKELDIGEYKSFDLNGMSINCGCYKSELGNVAYIKGGNDMMHLDTLIISPIYKDTYLYSYDRVKAFGSDNILAELYDVLINKDNDDLSDKLNALLDNYKDVEDVKHPSMWYDSILLDVSVNKKGSIELSDRFDTLAYDYLKEYLDNSSKVMKCDETKKRELVKQYCDKLLSNGGPSTDVFIKSKGREFCEGLFHKVMFNID